MAIIYGLKVNLSVAMVAMLNHTALAAESEHLNIGHGNITEDTDPECVGSDSSEAMEVG